MNKGRRTELRNLKWKKRLRKWGLSWQQRHKWIAFQKQAKPCSCYGCRGEKYKREKFNYELFR